MKESKSHRSLHHTFGVGPDPTLEEERALFTVGDWAMCDSGEPFKISHIDVGPDGSARLWQWSEYGYTFFTVIKCTPVDVVPRR